jgi:hypothetical protein
MVLKKAIQLEKNGLYVNIPDASGAPTSDGLMLPNPPIQRMTKNKVNHPIARSYNAKKIKK